MNFSNWATNEVIGACNLFCWVVCWAFVEMVNGPVSAHYCLFTFSAFLLSLPLHSSKTLPRKDRNHRSTDSGERI